MKTPLRLLLVEDSEDDALLVIEELERGGFEPECERVETAVALEEALRRQAWDVVVSDFRLPEFSGRTALQIVRASGGDLPFLIVSGTVGEETAVEMLKAGADDYLLKDRLGRLGSAVRHELESRRLRAEHERAQSQLRLLNVALDTAANGVLVTDRAGQILWANPAFTELTGYTLAEAAGQTPRLLRSGLHDAPFYEAFWKTISAGRTWRGEFTNRRKDGRLYHDEHTVTPVCGAGGRITHFIGIMHDVTARKEAEDELRRANTKLRHLLEHSPAVIYSLRVAGHQAEAQMVSENLTRILGFAPDEVRRPEWWANQLHPEDRERVQAGLAATLAEDNYALEYRLRHQAGHFVWVEDRRRTVRDASGEPVEIAGVWTDITHRKESEAALRESEARTRLAVAASNIGFWDWNVLTNQVYFSPEWKGQLGYAETEFPNRFEEWESRLHPDDRTPTLARLREFLDGLAAEYAVEFRLRHRDGSYRWIFTEAQVTRDASGRPVRMVGCHLDLTERKNAEAALRESERKYRLMVDNMAECVLVLDLGLRNVFASPSVLKIYGYTPDEFVTLPLDRVMSPDAFRQAKQAFAEEMALEASGVADPDRTRRMELLQHRKDGSPIWIESTLSFIRDATGRPAQILCVAKDITERRQARLALEESRHLLEQAQIVGHIGSWMLELGSPAKLIWSAETCRIFGVLPGEFDGRLDTFVALVHPEDREAVTRASQAALAGERDYDLDHRIVRSDGQTRWVHEQADIQRDASGRPERVVGVAQDITDRKRLEDQLRQAQKMEAIGQLAGGIAHDFNNILGAILGNAELIPLLPPGSPEAAECLNDILAGSRRASDLVGQILAFSRRQESIRQPMLLQPVVREVLKLLRATVPANIEFRANLASAPAVLANPSELHQVTMNLCTNAWHAMQGRPGVVLVELAEARLDEAFTRLHPDLRPGNYVRLTVADNGSGMEPATLERIFEPFFTTKPTGVGTGLGLSVVHGIVKNHEGGIVVESRPGEGSIFQLFFPVFIAAPVSNPAGPQAPVPLGADEHILFVDDEEALVRMARVILERLGYRVTTHTDPKAALADFLARPAEFSLAVVDYNMPALNGLELGAAMLERRPGQRIILATGYSATLTADELRQLGFCELMAKPYDIRCLAETVRRVLYRPNLRP